MRKPLTLGYFVKQKPDVRTYQAESNLPLSDHAIGIEIELEGIQYPRDLFEQALGYWDVHNDESLRNHGMEFISLPVRGKDIELALDELHLVLNTLKFIPQLSYRTSTHIHTDVRNFKFYQLRSLLTIYSLCEPWLFAYAGKEREVNSYCKPLYANPSMQQGAFQLLHTKVKGPNYGHALLSTIINNHCSHYDALSLTAILKHGTVEFRHLPGVYEKTQLMLWIKTVLNLIKYAKEHRPKDIINHVLERGAYHTIREAIPQLNPTPLPEYIECATNSFLKIVALKQTPYSFKPLNKQEVT